MPDTDPIYVKLLEVADGEADIGGAGMNDMELGFAALHP